MPEPVRLDEPIISSTLLEQLLADRLAPGTAAVEIGCGDGSTPHLADVCAAAGVHLHAVDTSTAKLSIAREQTRARDAVSYVRAPGEDFLRGFAERVSFAYLDNYDWIDSAADRNPHYPPGLTRRESELVHLDQTLLLRPKLAPRALVLFDDTWLLERHPPASGQLREPYALEGLANEDILEGYDVFGKGSLAVPYLLAEGFRLVAYVERPVSTQVLLRAPDPGEERPDRPYRTGYFEALLAEHRKVVYPSGGAAFVLHGSTQRLRWLLENLRLRLRLRTRLATLAGRHR